MAAPLKSNFVVSTKIDAFYTGGKVLLSQDGLHMFCQCNEKIKILEVETGKVVHTVIQDDEDEITCFTVTNDSQVLVTAARNLLLRQWDWKDKVCTRTWKAIHAAPVASMTFDSTSTLLATGGCDSTIKIWDIIKQYCTHNLKGSHGVVSIVQFHPDISRLQLYSASDDYKIRIWDLQTSRCIAFLESHFSAVTAMSFTEDGDTMVSSGRDNVVIVWDVVNYSAKRTIPVYETVEGVLLLTKKLLPEIHVDDKNLYFITAGSKGLFRVWNAGTGNCVFTQTNSITQKPPSKKTSDEQDPAGNIVQLHRCDALNVLCVVSYDHNIVFYNIDDFNLVKQFVGYNDEVLDVKLMGEKETHIAVATNSEQIRIIELSTQNCQILTGHSDIVLSLDVFKDGLLMVSSSKDNTIRLWKMDVSTGTVSCIGVGSGHTHGIGTVATPSHPKISLGISRLDINSVAVSPNDKLIATGSQDKSAKIWSSNKASLLGVCRGHRRGIWCLQFSPVDQVLATSSADGTIKIWSISDFTCLKTFEGHDSSVLKVIFLSRGMQIMSSGSDGLLKLWTIKTNECVNTFDEHQDKCWALVAKKPGDYIISGAADSTLIIWQDVTEIEKEEILSKQEHDILKEQELSNLLQRKKYLKAIGIAITLDQPFKALYIIKEILSEPNGKEDLSKTLGKLRADQLDAIMKFAIHWNTNSKHCHHAQTVLQLILCSISPDDLMAYPHAKECVQAFLPYTERHFQRMNRLLQQSMFIEYTWHKMRMVAGDTSSTNVAMEIHQPAFSVDKSKSMDQSDSDNSSQSDEDEKSVSQSDSSSAAEDNQLVEKKFNNQLDSDDSSQSDSDEAAEDANSVSQSDSQDESADQAEIKRLRTTKSRTKKIKPMQIDKIESESESENEIKIRKHEKTASKMSLRTRMSKRKHLENDKSRNVVHDEKENVPSDDEDVPQQRNGMRLKRKTIKKVSEVSLVTPKTKKKIPSQKVMEVTSRRSLRKRK
uniref:Transducin (Beta)-like 3 n=1 Tax=Saccoglossus kowalevskii TaxID=10224 RepID=A0ABM0GP68_SACKO|nr:PREDICTED: transducin (beta)-like 3 [Saccoglossus kowalevskii]